MSRRVIFDLDGTLSLPEHRIHFIEGENADWDAFYQACGDDDPNYPVITVLQSLWQTGELIVIWTGREESVRGRTLEWLANHNIHYAELKMRPTKDYTPDDHLKELWLKELGAQNVLMAFDDRDKVVDMWRRNDVVCFQVAPGNF